LDILKDSYFTSTKAPSASPLLVRQKPGDLDLREVPGQVPAIVHDAKDLNDARLQVPEHHEVARRINPLVIFRDVVAAEGQMVNPKAGQQVRARSSCGPLGIFGKVGHSLIDKRFIPKRRCVPKFLDRPIPNSCNVSEGGRGDSHLIRWLRGHLASGAASAPDESADFGAGVQGSVIAALYSLDPFLRRAAKPFDLRFIFSGLALQQMEASPHRLAGIAKAAFADAGIDEVVEMVRQINIPRRHWVPLFFRIAALGNSCQHLLPTRARVGDVSR
jgi:hypothetical protein